MQGCLKLYSWEKPEKFIEKIENIDIRTMAPGQYSIREGLEEIDLPFKG